MRITLPDGSVKEYDHPVTAAQVAAAIGAGLAKAAVGAKVNGTLSDLHLPIEADARLDIITKPRTDKKGRSKGIINPDALYLLRHSCAHVMAEAIERLWPETLLAYGPPLENGFYYDIYLDAPISSDDFPRIEAEMKKIVQEDRPFTRYELAPDRGFEKLGKEGNKYKLDNAQRAIDAGTASLSWYITGAAEAGFWEDLCMGPHLPSTGHIGAFKVTSIASSHWHGDVQSDRFQRIYGTAFFTQADLDQHLAQLEEARKRDHRVIGQKLGLFTIDEQVGPGLILWKPRGAMVRTILQDFLQKELFRRGYEVVYTPHIGKIDLYKTSGHYPYYSDSQFPPIRMREVGYGQTAVGAAIEGEVEGRTSEAVSRPRLHGGDGGRCGGGEPSGEGGGSAGEQVGEGGSGSFSGAPSGVFSDSTSSHPSLMTEYLLRPMNCPHHIKIYASEPHSYRDLPVRLAEFGTVYRFEKSGELSGMTRVRGFTQDDAHIFCTQDQVQGEFRATVELVQFVFRTFGFEDVSIRLSLRDPDSDKYAGDPAQWDRAESELRSVLQEMKIPFAEEPGEAAFYGPKVDFVVRDVIGRSWQLGTVQLDYNLPKRFEITYIGPDNQPHQPVMIHRAPFGSMERFMAILIEHYNGAFPLWLSPEQVRILPISEKSVPYGKQVLAQLQDAGLLTTLDESDGRVQAKIRDAQAWKVNYMLIVGPRDAENQTVSVRDRIRGDLGPLPVSQFVSQALAEIQSRGQSNVSA